MEELVIGSGKLMCNLGYGRRKDGWDFLISELQVKTLH